MGVTHRLLAWLAAAFDVIASQALGDTLSRIRQT
jgi:hypothetical protein